VTIATFESAYRHMPRIGARFGLLVVDEVHHFGSGVRDEALEMCLAEQRLGLTATPPSPAALERLESLIGPVAFQLNVRDLAGTWLAPFDSVVLRLGLDDDERARHNADYALFRAFRLKFEEHTPNGSWRELVAAAAQTEEGRAAIAAWRRTRRLIGYTKAKAEALRTLLERHRGSRVLVFTADNAAAYAIAREHLVMPITCDVSRAEREQALAAFREGELLTLVSARVLNEGIDVPDAEVAIIVGGTQGAREHVQRIGRLLRPRAGKRALVYEMVTLGTAEARLAATRRQGLVAARAV
jgi:superfamily II DNA or RNA helicase